MLKFFRNWIEKVWYRSKSSKELFGVTDMTIRRDLIDLEKQGLLVRVHGGAHKKSKIAY